MAPDHQPKGTAHEDLQPLFDLLGGKSGPLAQVTAWFMALRLAFKPFSGWIQLGFTRAVLFVQGTPERDDDLLVERILASPAYRLLAFLVDWTTSIKLPNSESLKKVYEIEGFNDDPPSTPKPPTTPPLAGSFALLLVGLALCAFSGCARFTTTQQDLNYDSATGKPIREITTRATAHTFFEAKSALANFKATQTDKSQSAAVGSLTQESGATNAVRTLEAIAEILKATK